MMVFPEMQDVEEKTNEIAKSQEKSEDSQEKLKTIEAKLDALIGMVKTLEVITNETKK